VPVMNTSLPPTARPNQRHLLTRLQRDWDRLAASRSALRTARSWPISVERYDSLDELLRQLGFGRVRPSGSHDDDGVLCELLLIARTDDFAARVVLQRILPGLASITRRRAHTRTEELDQFDEVLATAWTVIRCFPVERRPHYVAANLLRDVDYQVFRRPYRRVTKSVPTAGEFFDRTVGVADVVDDDDPRAELDELLRLAERSGLGAEDLELARRLGSGASTVEIAAERNVTDRTIRNHRAALILRLRRIAAEAAALDAEALAA